MISQFMSGDIRKTWDRLLIEELDPDINNMLTELRPVRDHMARAGAGGDPLVSRGSWVYDDLDEDEITVGRREDPVEEAMRLFAATRSKREVSCRRRRLSSSCL